jgi:DDE superfamily endonuclease
MDTQTAISQLQQFRAELYQLLTARPDTLLDLLDAVSGSPDARSVVELSLSPLFRREYSSLTDAIDAFFQASQPDRAAAERQAWNQDLARLIGRYLPAPQPRRFWLFGIDVVPVSRPFAQTLKDRAFVYQPNPVGSNKPVTIGHAYSVMAFLPEKGQPDDPPWVLPLDVRRVQSHETARQVGAEQVEALLQDDTLPIQDGLCVQVADSAYSGAGYLGRLGALRNLVIVTRAADNRVFYRQVSAAPEESGVGHPTWYGAPFDLKDRATWGTPDDTAETTFTTKRGRTYRVQLQGWHNLLMRGKWNLPMQRYPFTLLRAVVLDEQGQPGFKRVLWLIVFGARRSELSLGEAWDAYRQRYDLEHFFRFGKQRLLLAAYQTPDVEHEENWLTLVQLATVQLWLGRDLAGVHLRSWERYLPQRAAGGASPSQVQRDWERIIRRIGTPAQPPKRRGNSPGRATGTRPERRPRQPVVKKSARTAPLRV